MASACEHDRDGATTTAAARLVVGRNDMAVTGPYGGERGTGDALVTIVFTDIDFNRPCPAP